MGFLDTVLNKTTVQGTTTGGTTTSTSGITTANGATIGSADVLTNSNGHRIDPSFLDALYAMGKLTQSQRENLLVHLDPRTLGLSAYDLWYLTAGQYGDRVLPIDPNANTQVVILDTFSESATDVVGAATAELFDQHLLIEAGQAEAGDFFDFSFMLSQASQNGVETTRVRVHLNNTNGAVLFDSGAISVPSDTELPLTGTLIIKEGGKSGSFKSFASIPPAVSDGNHSAAFDTTKDNKIVVAITHGSSSNDNITELHAGQLRRYRKLS